MSSQNFNTILEDFDQYNLIKEDKEKTMNKIDQKINFSKIRTEILDILNSIEKIVEVHQIEVI